MNNNGHHCPRCLMGFMMPDIDGDPTCINCGYILYQKIERRGRPPGRETIRKRQLAARL